MGRKILADPELPLKLAEGRIEDIRPCIYCYTCVSTAYLREQVRCAVRSETGYDDLDWSPAVVPDHAVIVGGGPGGMGGGAATESGRREGDFDREIGPAGRDAFVLRPLPMNPMSVC
jgi:hypothetical protein